MVIDPFHRIMPGTRDLEQTRAIALSLRQDPTGILDGHHRAPPA